MKNLGRLAYVVIAMVLFISTMHLIGDALNVLIPKEVFWQNVPKTILGMVTMLLYSVCYWYTAFSLFIHLEK